MKEIEKNIKVAFDSGNLDYAYNLIVKNYSEQLYWHVRRMVIIHDDANDVVQNTFIKVWKALPKFKWESALYTWLYRIATNECITFINKKKRVAFISISNVEENWVRSLEADALFDGNEAELQLQKALLELPQQQRTIFNMRYFDELKFSEIAVILSLSVGGVKSSYHHARKKIEHFLLED